MEPEQLINHIRTEIGQYDKEEDIYIEHGYRDTARELSYSQCELCIDTLEFYIATGADEIEGEQTHIENLDWWYRRYKFFKDQDDLYHIKRHYPKLYQCEDKWYNEYDLYENY